MNNNDPDELRRMVENLLHALSEPITPHVWAQIHHVVLYPYVTHTEVRLFNRWIHPIRTYNIFTAHIDAHVKSVRLPRIPIRVDVPGFGWITVRKWRALGSPTRPASV